ncbi:MAG: hypothetical protein M3680_08680 [Myxococcota bacterium]|nr:hypothetical protein [Myxococcota bacterium]
MRSPGLVVVAFVSTTLLGAGGGCGGKKQEAGPAGGSGSAAITSAAQADAAAATVTDAVVELFVDDRSVAKVTAAQLAAWPRLDTLVPDDARRLGTWTRIGFTTAAGGTPTTLDKPSANHPDKVPVLFPGADGTAAFGMFDPVELAKRGQPGFRTDAVRELRITKSTQDRGGDHQGSTGEGADPTKLVVAIKTADGERSLTGAKILALPREPQPGNEDTKGWRITQFLTAAGVTTYTSLVLVDASGMTLPLTKADLDPTTSNPFIKLNKQGALRFRLYKKQGDGWQAGADLRSLVSIQVK